MGQHECPPRNNPFVFCACHATSKEANNCRMCNPKAPRPISVRMRRVYTFDLTKPFRTENAMVSYGAYDVGCRKCTDWSGNGTYPVDQKTAIKLGLQHLRETHS